MGCRHTRTHIFTHTVTEAHSLEAFIQRKGSSKAEFLEKLSGIANTLENNKNSYVNNCPTLSFLVGAFSSICKVSWIPLEGNRGLRWSQDRWTGNNSLTKDPCPWRWQLACWGRDMSYLDECQVPLITSPFDR